MNVGFVTTFAITSIVKSFVPTLSQIMRENTE